MLNLFDVRQIDGIIHAIINIEGREFETYLCASQDFKKRNESKIALDDYFRTNAEPGESHYEFCVRQGWQKYIDEMLAVDFLILNRDRHGANIEVLRNARAHTIRIAPLFDHGLSLIYSCMTDAAAQKFNELEDKKCQNFIGTYSCYDNLNLIKEPRNVFRGKLSEQDKEYLFDGLQGILSPAFMDKIWDMIHKRYLVYENL